MSARPNYELVLELVLQGAPGVFSPNFLKRAAFTSCVISPVARAILRGYHINCPYSTVTPCAFSPRWQRTPPQEQTCPKHASIMCASCCATVGQEPLVACVTCRAIYHHKCPPYASPYWHRRHHYDYKHTDIGVMCSTCAQQHERILHHPSPRHERMVDWW